VLVAVLAGVCVVFAAIVKRLVVVAILVEDLFVTFPESQKW
jgi:hypothetical protein